MMDIATKLSCSSIIEEITDFGLESQNINDGYVRSKAIGIFIKEKNSPDEHEFIWRCERQLFETFRCLARDKQTYGGFRYSNMQEMNLLLLQPFYQLTKNFNLSGTTHLRDIYLQEERVYNIYQVYSQKILFYIKYETEYSSSFKTYAGYHSYDNRFRGRFINLKLVFFKYPDNGDPRDVTKFTKKLEQYPEIEFIVNNEELLNLHMEHLVIL